MPRRKSIKSLEGYNIAWVEEAQTLSARSLALLRPTIRADGSEIWFSWNPRRKSDAVDEFLRGQKPENAIVVKANWRDNPWFPSVLEDERNLDLKTYPDRYHHVWEGDYAKAFEGAYYAGVLADARREGRIGQAYRRSNSSNQIVLGYWRCRRSGRRMCNLGGSVCWAGNPSA